jgi:hypothetical protein
MRKKISFYSNVHLGDIHLGRSYIKWFVDNFEADFFYSHNYDHTVLSDIDNLIFDNQNYKFLPRDSDIIEKENFIFLNTWIGAGGLAVGCNFKAIFILFTKYFNFLKSKGILCKQDSLPDLLPKIHFNHQSIKTKKIDEWFKNRDKNKRILICNNVPQSGQSFTESLNSFIINLSNLYPQYEFYVTNQENPLVSRSNVFYIDTIINEQQKFNLNQISYFSTYCDIIVGRGSGPFSFCEIEENLNKTWVSLTFEHLFSDAFNGFHKFPNQGIYIHSLNEQVFMKAFQS